MLPPYPRFLLPGYLFVGVALLGPGLSGCKKETPPSLPPGLFLPQTTDSPLRLREVAAEAGVTFRWSITAPRPLTILQTIGRGCAFLDYDRDGNLDILLVADRPALFQGDGQGRFRDVSEQTGISQQIGHFSGCAVGDIDNDSYPDLYLSGYREGRLLKNREGRRFTDETAARGLKAQPWGTSAGFADMDRDGYLDLFVNNYVDYHPDRPPQLCSPGSGKGQILTACGPNQYQPLQAVLYRNLGGRGFLEATRAWGLHRHSGNGLGVAFADLEGQGNLSIVVANDEQPADLFVATFPQKNLSLENRGREAGIAFTSNGAAYAGMGVDIGDFDNDGDFDLLCTAFAREVKPLFSSNGDGTFTNVAYTSGYSPATILFLPFGCKFADFDNDGWQDILLANGHVQSNQEAFVAADPGSYRQKVQLLRNVQGRYVDVGEASGLARISPIVGRGLAVGDYDNDGCVDALVVDNEGAPLLLHNETPSPGHFLGLSLWDRSGKVAYNARVEVRAEGKTYLRQCHPCGSYLSSSDPRVLVGIGSATTVQAVAIRWPDGQRTLLKNLVADRYHEIRQ